MPIVIGVSGHQDLRTQDVEPLRATVRRFVETLRRDHPSTPLVVMSPLAQGADCLVARVIVEAGGRLVVPLPMPRSLYEADFVDAAAHQEFVALLEIADRCIELPLVTGSTEETVAVRGPARDRQYELAGAYVALHSQILLALWDGRETGLVGGTAAVVRFKLKGTYGVLDVDGGPLDAPDNGPVYHIETPRLAHAPAAAPTFVVRTLLPDRFARHPERGDELYKTVYRRIDTFNRDAIALTDVLAHQRRVSAETLTPATPDHPLPPGLAPLRDVFAVADSLALHFQRRTDTRLVWMFAIVFLAVVLFDAYTHHVVSSAGVFVLAIACVVAARIVWRQTRREDLQNRHQDYRTLAEGLRVLFFWRAAGIEDSVAENYLRKQRGELDWIRNAIRSVRWAKGADTGGQPHTGGSDPAALAWVRRQWIEAQVAYFTRAMVRDHRRERCLHRWSRRAMWVNLAALVSVSAVLFLRYAADPIAGAVPAAAPVAAALAPYAGVLARSTAWFFVIVGMASVAAALLHNLAEKRAYAEHIKQFQRMLSTFQRAADEVARREKAGDHQGVLDLLRDLGREALTEHGDWLLLHRDRPLELPEEGLRYSSILKKIP